VQLRRQRAPLIDSLFALFVVSAMVYAVGGRGRREWAPKIESVRRDPAREQDLLREQQRLNDLSQGAAYSQAVRVQAQR
jgi:hypothetical protein